MEAQIRKLFDRYEQLFKQGLDGALDLGELASVYASAFVAASPAGVIVGKNDDQLQRSFHSLIQERNRPYRP